MPLGVLPGSSSWIDLDANSFCSAYDTEGTPVPYGSCCVLMLLVVTRCCIELLTSMQANTLLL